MGHIGSPTTVVSLINNPVRDHLNTLTPVRTLGSVRLGDHTLWSVSLDVLDMMSGILHSVLDEGRFGPPSQGTLEPLGWRWGHTDLPP